MAWVCSTRHPLSAHAQNIRHKRMTPGQLATCSQHCAALLGEGWGWKGNVRHLYYIPPDPLGRRQWAVGRGWGELAVKASVRGMREGWGGRS